MANSRGREDDAKEPGLPEMKSPGGNENQNENKDLKEDQPAECVARKSVHEWVPSRF